MYKDQIVLQAQMRNCLNEEKTKQMKKELCERPQKCATFIMMDYMVHYHVFHHCECSRLVWPF